MTETASTKEEIKFLWQKHINPMVSLKELDNNIMMLRSQGFKLDYLLFCLEYVIRHNMGLKHPAGFKYYVDREDILTSYRLSKIKRVDLYSFKVSKEEGVKFSIKKTSKGFGRILRKNY